MLHRRELRGLFALMRITTALLPIPFIDEDMPSISSVPSRFFFVFPPFPPAQPPTTPTPNMSAPTKPTNHPNVHYPRVYEDRVDGSLILSVMEREKFSKKGALKKLKDDSCDTFIYWVDVQATIELTMAALGEAVDYPAFPADTWIRAEIPIPGARYTMRRNYERAIVKFVKNQVPDLCARISNEQIATLLGLRFEPEQLQMHLYQRRVYAILTMFAIQQNTECTQHPLGSHEAALAVDYERIQEQYLFEEKGERAPPVTPFKKTEDEEIDAEMSLIAAAHRADDESAQPVPEELPSAQELREEKLVADAAMRSAIDKRVAELFAAKTIDERGAAATAAAEIEINRMLDGDRAKKRFKPSSSNGSSSSGTSDSKGHCVMPSAATVATIKESPGMLPSDADRIQSDDVIVRALVGGTVVSMATLWKSVQAVAGRDSDPTFTVNNEGITVSSSNRTARGTEPTTMEDMMRCHRLLLACIADIDSSAAFEEAWLRTFTFTIFECSVKCHRDIAMLVQYYDRHFRVAWKNLCNAKWTSLKLDTTLLSQVQHDLEHRRRQLGQEREQQRRVRGPHQSPGRFPVQQRRQIWDGPITADMRGQTCKNYVQGRPCALVTPTGQCVFVHPPQGPPQQQQNRGFGNRRPSGR